MCRKKRAEQEGCSASRASKLSARVREDFRHAALYLISDARRILRYVVEEPCITYREIVEDLRMESEDVDRALRCLTDPVFAYLSESNGRSFVATSRGMEAATGPAIPGAVGRLMI